MRTFFAATLGAAVILGLANWLTYDVWLADFVRDHTQPLLGRPSALLLPMLGAVLFQGALLTIMYWQWPGMASLGRGFFAGALIGFFLGAAFNLDLYAITAVKDLNFVLLEPLLWAARFGLAGAIAARYVGLKK